MNDADIVVNMGLSEKQIKKSLFKKVESSILCDLKDKPLKEFFTKDRRKRVEVSVP